MPTVSISIQKDTITAAAIKYRAGSSLAACASNYSQLHPTKILHANA